MSNRLQRETPSTSFQAPGFEKILSFLFPLANVPAAKVYAFLAYLIGLTVGLGWLISAEPLVRFIPDSAVMAFNATVFTVLAGLSMWIGSPRFGPMIRRTVGGVLILGSSLIFMESVLNTDFGIDWASRHEPMSGFSINPGRLAPTTCIAFFLIGFVLQRLDSQPGVVKPVHMRLAFAGIIAMCAVGVVGYLLDLSLLYAWYKYNRMALPTAIAVLLLTLSLACHYQASCWSQSRPASQEGSRIVTIGMVLLLVMGMAAGLTGFVMFMDYQKTFVVAQVQDAALSRSSLIEANINEQINRMRLTATQTQLADEVRSAAMGGKSVVGSAVTSLNREGFSSLTVLDADGALLTQVGKRIVQSPTEIVLRAVVPAKLMWSEGFVLEASTAVFSKEDGAVATVVIQRRMGELLPIMLDRSSLGNTANVTLCGRTIAGAVGCFPTTDDQTPRRIKPSDRKLWVPIDSAIEGSSGLHSGADFRGERVIASYVPVSKLGLALILKLDSSELFSPIRHLLERTLLTLCALLLVGVLILRRLIKPLVRRIMDSEKHAQIANALAVEREERTRTIVDHVFDGILSMDGNGIIQTCNPAACSMFNYSATELVGQHFSFLLPKRHRNAARSIFTQYQDPGYPSSLKTHVLKLRGMRSGGSEFHFELGANEVTLSGRRGYVAILHDVTESYEGRRLLARSEKMLRTVTDNLPALVGYVDAQHVVRFANKTYEAWFGKPLNKIIGQPLEALVGNTYEDYRLHIETALNGEPVAFERRMVCAATGVPICWLESYIPDFGANGGVAGFYVLAADITERKNHEEALRHLAYHDTLTELPNRRLFNDRLDQAILRGMRQQKMIALFYLDIDRFKGINDTLGHDNGDVLLKVFAERLGSTVRASDTVGRMGGDEFTIVMENVHRIEDIEHVAEKILQAVRVPLQLGEHTLHISTSIGIAVYSGGTIEREEFVKCSDEALYASKQAGRDRYTLRHYTAISHNTLRPAA